MKDALKDFRKAVGEAIKANHKLGLPAYQREGDYIIAIYPGGKKTKLERIEPSRGDFKLWQFL
jgi:hypothetical protein